MANPSKKKGTRAETTVVRYINEQFGRDIAERRSLKGSKDEGDILISFPSGFRFVIEVKSGKQTKAYSRKLKAEWLEQTKTESSNANLPCMLVIASYGRSVSDYEVWNADGVIFHYLDDYVDLLKECHPYFYPNCDDPHSA